MFPLSASINNPQNAVIIPAAVLTPVVIKNYAANYQSIRQIAMAAEREC